ncbi:Por secretion system C-terminal sorting domain-containing protein [Spirosoma endophyticum]|uniref:Por secretion system C-terminal sorting domain-containing protein n=2 Tax=Spirosoma endophyticum TaxID=662367 RepID=A0A1I2DH65_9BACT|nr:Por secretion system C-terminal sorting domain-containing protein [Spirosoma endophyticum]
MANGWLIALLWLLALRPLHAQQVVSTLPGLNANTAPTNTAISLTANTTLPVDYKLNVFSAQAGGQKAGLNQVANNTATFYPATAFKPGEVVYVTAPASGYVYQFTTAAGVGPGTFLAGTNVGVGDYPLSFVAADVDGDGDLDLLAANHFTSTVSIRVNDGKGNFSGDSQVSVEYYPSSMIAADVDGDGDLDILAGSIQFNNVSVRFNDGKGNFSGNAQYATAGIPRNIMAADIDGDGDLDILATSDSGYVLIYFNNGTGNFADHYFVVGGHRPISMALADVDGDGDLDVLTLSQFGHNVHVMFNNGHGIFSSHYDNNRVDLGEFSYPNTIVAADVDGDGDPDFLTTNGGHDDVSVRFNDGKGNFSGNSQVSVGEVPLSITVADVDGDGDLDILTANNRSKDVSVRLNNGRGSFSGNIQVRMDDDPNKVVAADVDGDGDLDFLTANYPNGRVSVRFNQAASMPVTLKEFTAKAETDMVRLAWQTELETHFAGFQIERSLDAKEFSPLGWQEAKASTQGGSAYGFNDLSLPSTASTLYYRLKMVDQDGSVAYSSIKSVVLNTQSLGLVVLGNPVRDNLQLIISSPLAQSLQVQVLSMGGQVVHQQTLQVSEGRSQTEIGLVGLTAGLYQLVVSDGLSRRMERVLIE